MKEKPKRDNRSRAILNNLSFFLLWIVLTIVLGKISGGIFDWLYRITGNGLTDMLVLINGLLFASFILPVEKFLLKLRFGQWIKGWIIAGFLSNFINTIQFFIFRALHLEMLNTNFVQSLPYFLVIGFLMALPQAWVLRRYVQKSWLYPLVAMISSVFPMLLLPYVADSAFAPSIMLASSVFLTPLVLLWLFRGTPKAEKMKRAENASYEHLEDSSPEIDDIQEEESFEAKRKRLRVRLKYLFLSWAR